MLCDECRLRMRTKNTISRRTTQWLTGAMLGLVLILPAIAMAEAPQQVTQALDNEPLPPVTPAVSPLAEPPALADTKVEPVELKASAIKTENQPIDLVTVLKLVEDQNLFIAQNRKNTEILKTRLWQREAALLPSIDASYSQNWQQGQQRFISGGGGGFIVGGGGGSGGTGGGGGRSRGSSEVQTFLQPQLGASWTIHPGGRNIYEVLAAKQRNRAANSLLKGTVQEQLAQSAEEYYKLLAAYIQKGVVVRSIIQSREQVKMNQAKVAVGKGIPLDLSRAKTAYAQQQSALVQAENTIIQAEQVLLNRLNLDPTIHLVPDELDARKKPLLLEDVPVERLIADAIHNNPAIQRGEEELKALGYDYKTVRSDVIPSMTLRAFTRGSGSELNDLQRSNSGGITITANLLENMGIQLPLRLREQRKLIEQKMLAQQQLVRDVESQVMTAYLGSENYKSALEAAEQELTSALESYDLAVGRFKAGYGINIDVLDAEAALSNARSNLVQVVLNYNQAQVQLVEALGKVTPETLVKGLPIAKAVQAGEEQTQGIQKGVIPNDSTNNP